MPQRVWTVYQHSETDEDKKRKRVWTQVEQEWKNLRDSGRTAEAEAFCTRMFDRVNELMRIV